MHAIKVAKGWVCQVWLLQNRDVPVLWRENWSKSTTVITRAIFTCPSTAGPVFRIDCLLSLWRNKYDDDDDDDRPLFRHSLLCLTENHTCAINFAPSAFLGAFGAGSFFRLNMLSQIYRKKNNIQNIYIICLHNWRKQSMTYHVYQVSYHPISSVVVVV